jgi:hypothetical protein
MRAPTYCGVRVTGLKRLNNSVNGNPRYNVTFDNGTNGNTSSDASFCYGIENPAMRGAVDVWLTRRGLIEHMEPCKKATNEEVQA